MFGTSFADAHPWGITPPDGMISATMRGRKDAAGSLQNRGRPQCFLNRRVRPPWATRHGAGRSTSFGAGTNMPDWFGCAPDAVAAFRKMAGAVSTRRGPAQTSMNITSECSGPNCLYSLAGYGRLLVAASGFQSFFNLLEILNITHGIPYPYHFYKFVVYVQHEAIRQT